MLCVLGDLRSYGYILVAIAIAVAVYIAGTALGVDFIAAA